MATIIYLLTGKSFYTAQGCMVTHRLAMHEGRPHLEIVMEGPEDESL